VASRDGSGKPVVMPKGRPDAARTYSYTPPADQAEHYDGWSARSISVDGRYVSVGWNGTDPSRHLDSFAVIDTVANNVVRLPTTGAISSVHFFADGTALVRLASGQLLLVDRQFTVLDQVTEPAVVREFPLLRYVP
jgi:TolB protein